MLPAYLCQTESFLTELFEIELFFDIETVLILTGIVIYVLE